jgi:hypothetical protein
MDLATLKEIAITVGNLVSTALAFIRNNVSVCALFLAAFSAWWAGRQWKFQHMTKEWGNLVQFLVNYTAYLDPERNRNYQTAYHGEEKLKYEIVARLCLSYMDDVYYLKLWRFHDNWLVGSVKFLAGTHCIWLKDHKDAYSQDFYDDLMKALEKQGVSCQETKG